MIRKATEADFNSVYSIINDAAKAYKGVIPDQCWNEPYFSKQYLKDEINAGVEFWGYEEEGSLVGIMGVQEVRDVTLIRHAYVCTAFRNKGIGGILLTYLKGKTKLPILIGTWRDAYWAINFYRKHGFELISSPEEIDCLLRKYWSVSKLHRENSVVLKQVKTTQ